jgi:hypothetical protein
MDFNGDIDMVSLEFVEARPRSGSRRIMSGLRLQALDGVDVAFLLLVRERSPKKFGVNGNQCGCTDGLPFLALENLLASTVVGLSDV